MNKEQRSIKRKFKPQWLKINQFKLWLREISHDASSFSSITCNKSIAGGLLQIYRHADSKIHKTKSGNSNQIDRRFEYAN